MADFTFTSSGDKYVSDAFQPEGPFQVDLTFNQNTEENYIEVLSSNDSSSEFAVAAIMKFAPATRINFPVMQVFVDSPVYYKITSKIQPTSGNYVTA
jgi:hypothetical protein